jgi:hypothetical protein
LPNPVGFDIIAFVLRHRRNEEDFILPRKPEGKRVFGWRRYGFENNIKMDFKQMGEMNWTNSEYGPCGRFL